MNLNNKHNPESRLCLLTLTTMSCDDGSHSNTQGVDGTNSTWTDFRLPSFVSPSVKVCDFWLPNVKSTNIVLPDIDMLDFWPPISEFLSKVDVS